MAELLANGADWKDLTTETTLAADGSATIKLAGAPGGHHPELRLGSADVVAVLKGLSKPVTPPPVEPPPPPPPAAGFIAAIDTGDWGGDLHKELTAGGIIGRRIDNSLLVPQIEEMDGIVEVCIIGSPGDSPATIRGLFKAAANTYPNVKRLELMNEPSINGETAAGYAANVKAAREGIEESGNKTVLLLAEYGIERELAGWVKTPSLALVDEIVQHAYGPDGPKHVEAAHAATGKPIAITEFGAPTDVGGPTLSDQPQLSEAEQCIFMQERYATWKALSYVTIAVWFNAVDYGGGNWWGVKKENLANKLSFAVLGQICKALASAS